MSAAMILPLERLVYQGLKFGSFSRRWRYFLLGKEEGLERGIVASLG